MKIKEEKRIHPTAIIEEGASVASSVEIGPYCVVGSNVTLGDNVVLKAHVVVDGYTTIGEGTIIYPFASIGTAPQDLKFGGEKSTLVITTGNQRKGLLGRHQRITITHQQIATG